MLGFLIKNTDLSVIVNRINVLWESDYQDIPTQEYLYAGVIPATYISTHEVDESTLVLTHAFVDCTDIIN